MQHWLGSSGNELIGLQPMEAATTDASSPCLFQALLATNWAEASEYRFRIGASDDPVRLAAQEAYPHNRYRHRDRCKHPRLLAPGRASPSSCDFYELLERVFCARDLLVEAVFGADYIGGSCTAQTHMNMSE